MYGLQYKKHNNDKVVKYHLPILKSRKINDISVNNNMLYLATDSGVCFLDVYDKTKMSFVTKTGGLASNKCHKLVHEKGILWVATDGGISSIDIGNHENVSNISIFDGLASNYINDIIVENDTVWAATNEGLSVFPVKLKKRSVISLINIVDVKTYLKEHDFFQPIVLSPDSNSISISFSNMSFGNNVNGRYQYRLLPNVSYWSETAENTITFSELNHGDYTFEVKCFDENNILNNTVSTLNFKVQASFHQTLLFKILVGGLIVGLVGFLFLRKVKEIRRKNQINKVVSQLELEAIKAQINPHFIYNSLNSIKNTIIKNQNIEAEEQLSVFAKLVRQTLSISQLNFIPLSKEIDYLNNYLEMEKIRFKEKLNFTVSTNNISEPSLVKLPSMLIQPFVENAIKHGFPENEEIPSIISVEFSLYENGMICKVQDNGMGIHKSMNNKKAKHISKGIELTSSRAKKYNIIFNTNITITALDKIDNGTLITIKIPL